MILILIKVIGNGHSGVPELKELVGKIKGKSEIEWRTSLEIIQMIEEGHREIKELLELKSQNKANPEQLEFLRKIGNGADSWLDLNILEVDTSRKWVLYEYDNSVGIKYLKEEDYIEKIGYCGSL